MRVSFSVARQTFFRDRLPPFGSASKPTLRPACLDAAAGATLECCHTSAAGPDDPDLAFTAELEYRSVEE